MKTESLSSFKQYSATSRQLRNCFEHCIGKREHKNSTLMIKVNTKEYISANLEPESTTRESAFVIDSVKQEKKNARRGTRTLECEHITALT